MGAGSFAVVKAGHYTASSGVAGGPTIAGNIPSNPNGIFYTPKSRGVELIINITAQTGSGAITVTIQGYDPVSGTKYTILASASLGSNGQTILRVYPGLTGATNTIANDVMPGSWTVSVAQTGTSVDYSIGANMLI